VRIAIFGAGPAGFYAAEELLSQRSGCIAVDLFDRLPTPYGLVRGGVAPDHQKIKNVIKRYEKTAARPGFRFFGNVTFGGDLDLAEALAHYHQVLIATGAQSDRLLGIPGEDLLGSHSAAAFVAWYNGHPDYRDSVFDLRAETAVVIGNGNVAVDVARILTRSIDELETTDIAGHALEVLRESQINQVYLLGRRGPAQAAFTPAELNEMMRMKGVDFVVRPLDLDGTQAPAHSRAGSSPASRKNLELLRAQSERGDGIQPRKVRARFFTSPVEVLGKRRVEGLRVEHNRLTEGADGEVTSHGTGVFEEIPCQLIFRSIGYKGLQVPGIPFEERRGVIPHRDGRVVDPITNLPLARVYVAGWIKRGPSGVIGTNKGDAEATVRAMLADLDLHSKLTGLSLEEHDLPDVLARKKIEVVTFDHWKRIDGVEIAAGAPKGKPREKLTRIAELLAARSIE
jgi:ferredoxin--NADP+ reductase